MGPYIPLTSHIYFFNIPDEMITAFHMHQICVSSYQFGTCDQLIFFSGNIDFHFGLKNLAGCTHKVGEPCQRKNLHLCGGLYCLINTIPSISYQNKWFVYLPYVFKKLTFLK